MEQEDIVEGEGIEEEVEEDAE
jgi:hypothetical protein